MADEIVSKSRKHMDQEQKFNGVGCIWNPSRVERSCEKTEDTSTQKEMRETQHILSITPSSREYLSPRVS
jgi:hypothetical protein